MRRSMVFVTLLLVSAFAFAGGQTEQQKSVAFNRTGMPIVDEPVTVRMSANLYADNAPYGEMPFFQMMEDTTGVRVQWDLIPSQAYNERKTLLLAGGDLPDAMYKSGLTDFEMLSYSGQGAFRGLSGYLDDGLMPNVDRILNARPSVKALLTMPDGEFYSLPWIEEMKIVYSDSFFHMNQVWLDNLGLDVPVTTDDFVDVLRAFRDQDANGNGDPGDEVPFVYVPLGPQMGNGSSFAFLLGSFGRADNEEHIVVENGTVVFTADKPEYLEGVSFFADLYGEGLIYQESITFQSGADLRGFGQANEERIGSFPAWRSFSVVSLNASTNFIEVPPLVGPNGDQQWGRANRDEQLAKYAFVVSARTDYPEIIARWADFHYDTDISIQANYGMYDSVMIVNDAGLREMKPSSEWGGLSQNEVRSKASPTNGGPFAILFEFWGDVLYMWEGPAGRQRILREVYSPYVSDEYYPPLTFTLEEAEELQRYRQTIVDFVNQQTTKWVRDGKPITTAGWDAYIDTLDDMGLDKMMAVYQQAYDRYIANVE